MKALRSPLAVGILAAIALAYAAWTALGPTLRRTLRSSSAKSTTPALTTPAPASLPNALPNALPSSPELSVANPSPTNAPLPILQVSLIQQMFPAWLDAPSRDPFQSSIPRPPTPSGPRADQVLTLSAIWRQTGERLAMLNRTLMEEGDNIQGYALERIEPNAVWVRSTNGLERVGFQGALDADPSPTPSSAPSPSTTTAMARPPRQS